MDNLFEGIDDEGAKGVGDTYSELLDCRYGRCWSVVAESIECSMLLTACSCFHLWSASMKMNIPMGAGRLVARSYIAFALGRFGLNCLRGGMSGGGVP